MAKQVKEFSFSDLDKSLSKIDPLGSVMTENSFSRIDEWIPTGNYMLNAQLGGSIFKGAPNSRSIVFSGVSGTGKTFIVLNSVREMQKMGYYVIYGDSEAAVDETTMLNFGIDPAKIRYQPFKTVLQVRHFVANLTTTLKEKKAAGFDVPKIGMVLDSLGNLATEKEVTDAHTGSDKRDMTKQQNLKSLFRVITTDLAELKIPFYITNHVYACLHGNTLVETEDGQKYISDIKVGDYVHTMDGLKDVINTFKYDNAKTLIIETEHGNIECTPNHKFMVKINNTFEWKCAEDLKIDDEILKIEKFDSIDMIYKENRKYHGSELISFNIE